MRRPIAGLCGEHCVVRQWGWQAPTPLKSIVTEGTYRRRRAALRMAVPAAMTLFDTLHLRKALRGRHLHDAVMLHLIGQQLDPEALYVDYRRQANAPEQVTVAMVHRSDLEALQAQASQYRMPLVRAEPEHHALMRYARFGGVPYETPLLGRRDDHILLFRPSEADSGCVRYGLDQAKTLVQRLDGGHVFACMAPWAGIDTCDALTLDQAIATGLVLKA